MHRKLQIIERVSATGNALTKELDDLKMLVVEVGL